MKFNEWRDRLQVAHDKVKDIALYEISESFAINQGFLRNITVTIGKHTGAIVDGNPTDIRYLRHLFTGAKLEFEAVLESLEGTANTYVEAMGGLLSAVTSEIVPELVIDRLTGEEITGDNREMLQRMVNKKMQELLSNCTKYDGLLTQFEIELVMSEDTKLIFRLNPVQLTLISDSENGRLSIKGSFRDGGMLVNTVSIEAGLKFLGLSEQIKVKLAKLSDWLEDLRQGRVGKTLLRG